MYIEYSKTMHFNKKIDGRTEFLPSFARYSKQQNIRIEIETNTLTETKRNIRLASTKLLMNEKLHNAFS